VWPTEACDGPRRAAALQPLIDRFAEHGDDPAMLTIEDYFADGLGIGPDDQEALRAIVVER
jgi:hypothetical protein